ncbi:MAG: hypothetical protein JST82_14025 [Bacteroidetes bacterium]|nr:hypothetical protein [Bacteroidota bacterium]
MPTNKTFPSNSLDSLLRMHISSDSPEYWFYHLGDYLLGNPTYYGQLIDNANSYIEIWDPYFNVDPPNSDQDVFRNIKDDVTIKILTIKKLSTSSNYLTDVENSLKSTITPSKNTRFGLRVINKSDAVNQGSRFFHDRFLIIDRSIVYLVGSSVGHHLSAKSSTGICKISNQETTSFILSLFDEYWRVSVNHHIPIRYLHP